MTPIARRGLMLVLSSPSGAGKTSISRALLAREPALSMSVSVTTRAPRPGEVDGKKLNDWIGELLKTKGGDIYRCKGVLAVKGSPNRLVFQGVHMLFDAKFDRPWGKDARTNTLVFIGKNLDRAALNAAFQACLS